MDNREMNTQEIREVLLEKINEEEEDIIQTQEEKNILDSIEYDNNKVNVVSLFSGAGGMDLGVELAGLSSVIGNDKAINKCFSKSKDEYDEIRNKSIFNIIYTNDLFKEANETYKMNFPNTVKQFSKDIRKISKFPKCQLMIGGFPCPGFSEAGPRLIDDKRNFLYIHFIRALTQVQPEFFIAENVKGMLTLGKGEVAKQIIEDFTSAGYTVKAFLVNARDYGVPQLRERVFLVGVHKTKIEMKFNFEYELPCPTHKDIKEYDLLNDYQPYVTLKEAIGDLEGCPGDYYEGSYSSMYMSRNRKKNWNDQSFTIQASGRQAPQHPSGEPMKKIDKNKWVFQGNRNRRLSVKEIARIQTFPDWFVFSSGIDNKGNKNNKLDKQYKQIGNAVPVILAKSIIQPISDFLYKHMKEIINNGN